MVPVYRLTGQRYRADDVEMMKLASFIQNVQDNDLRLTHATSVMTRSCLTLIESFWRIIKFRITFLTGSSSCPPS